MESICVLGSLGRMGGFHYEHLRKNPNVWESIGYDVKTAELRTNETYPDTDAYIIATPSETHYELAKELIEAGKDILVEKPMALNYGEAQTLYKLAQEYDVVLMVGHTERFNPVFRRALPELYGKELTYRRWCVKPGTDLVFDTMIHDLELALYLNNVTKIDDLQIKIISSSDKQIIVEIPPVGSFVVCYETDTNIREIIDLDGDQIINLLDVDKEKYDPLYYEHQHFLKLCRRGGYNGHARFAVAAVGLAERIQACTQK